MWSPSLSANFHIRRPDIVNHNITLRELSAMYHSLKESGG